jgi:hypothetical protein
VAFRLWSNKHHAWWRPNELGYTTRVEEAGFFTEEQAVRNVVNSAMCGDVRQVTCMVAAPGVLAMPANTLRVGDTLRTTFELYDRHAVDD